MHFVQVLLLSSQKKRHMWKQRALKKADISKLSIIKIYTSGTKRTILDSDCEGCIDFIEQNYSIFNLMFQVIVTINCVWIER